MDRFTALGIARCYGVYDDTPPPILWRRTVGGAPRSLTRLLDEADHLAALIAAFGWGTCHGDA